MGRDFSRVASFKDFTTSAEDISRWDATLCRLVHSYRLYEISCQLFFFLFLQRACCRVTQLLYQLLHIYSIYKIYTLKL